ncbi:MAG: aminotransferase class I/II-fold pyridoxal phosphate-dependent enzyme [Acidobacteriota bacterium]|nr:aminotransferase class I/II-fold pyridoxal phosphate-dependent enzyme [Acidobacteriota bacterium]
MSRVYLSPPHVFGQEELLVAEAFASNWLSPLGPHVDAFEREMAATAGTAHAVALSSGTAALHLAMAILGVGAGDTVICSSLTFSASAYPITYVQGAPVFVDSDDTWTMDPSLLEDALREADRRGRRPKAVIAVDLYGQCADYDVIRPLCDNYGVPLVVDAAEALGSTYRGRPAGSFGRMGVFSFNGNKIITTAGGGMLVSDDEEIAKKARFLATQARDPAPHYQHSVIGYNYRLSNVLAAIGRGQLATLPARVVARRKVFDRYVSDLGGLPGITFMPEASYGRGNRWLTCLTIDAAQFGATREDVRLALEADDIESRPVWKPMHLQPVFAGAPMFGGAVSERLFADGLCLPSGSSLTEHDQDRVIAIIERVARHRAVIS